MPAKEFTKTFTQLIMNRRLQHSEGWLPVTRHVQGLCCVWTLAQP